MALKFSIRAAWLLASAAAVLFGWGVLSRHLTPLLAQATLTSLSLAIGAAMTSLYLRPPPVRRAGMGAVGIVFVVASQFAFLLLVWTDAKQKADLWRFWWAAAVPSLVAAHLRLLRILGADWTERWARVALAGILGHGLLWILLVARRDMLANPPVWFVALIAAAGAAALLGTLVLLERWRRSRLPLPSTLPAALRYAAWGGAAGVLFLSGVYVGRITGSGDAVYEAFPSALAGLSDDEIRALVEGDFRRLRAAAEGIAPAADRMGPTRRRLQAALAGRERQVLTPQEDDELKATWMSFLSCRAALLRVLAIHAGFEAVRDPVLKARCFLLAFGAAAVLCEASGKVVVAFQDWPEGRAKLNEADPAWGIQAGMFDRIAAAMGSDRNAERFEEMAAYFEERGAGWKAGEVFARDDYAWLEGRVRSGVEAVRRLDIQVNRNWLRAMIARVKDDAYSPWYAVQSQISEWIGDTRIVTRPPLISHEQIATLAPQLQPGDIIIERRNFFLSNAFLPGFWPHAALYVGTEADLRGLGLLEDPAVKGKLEAYRRPAADGRPCSVIEAVSEGVIFNSLDHSIHADHVAILRPRVPRELKAQAIARAFGHAGKPYDFEFDFFSADKLVCTEVVYRAYEGVLHFDLQHVMGRDTLPAIEIVRKFARERGRGDRELDFVAFLDGLPAEGRAQERGPDEFCASAERSREFNQ